MNLEYRIFNIHEAGFDQLALDMFRFQHAENIVYRSFCDALHIDSKTVRDVASIPFLPVSLFKTHDVTTGSFKPETTFESSGTTATGNSRHLVRSKKLYEESFLRSFELFYGEVTDWCVIGLLPSYLERGNSSLVVMVDELIKRSKHKNSGFYLYEHDKLAQILNENEHAGQKTLLIGVTFALLDFAAEFNQPLTYTTVMETGGMKGRRREITREEVHHILKSSWRIENIHSEYGMTELLSQAYSKGEGRYVCPPWMKMLVREEDDPVSVHQPRPTVVNGLANIIDLANIYSCSFIAVDDICKLYPDGSFEILGRMDSSDVRGCSLMIS